MESEREPTSKLSRGRWMPEAHQSPWARTGTVMSERVRPKVGERQPCGTSTECSSEQHGAITTVNELMARMPTLTDALRPRNGDSSVQWLSTETVTQ
jgi:hypothetical protein